MEPIRILQVVTHMNRGGLETMLMNYYRHIDREKIQFDFLVHRRERAAYDDEIEALGGKIHRISRLVPWSRVYQRELRTFFLAHPEYRIVHVHQDCLSSVILKAAAECGIPVRIAHSHNSNQDKNLKYPIKLFYKNFIPKYATQLFACGKDAGDWMFGGAPYRVLTNAIDANAYCYDPAKVAAVRENLGIANSTFVVGHVGRFSPPKNHEFLIDVFAQLHKQEPDSVLLLVGGGDLQSHIQAKVKQLGLEDAVRFTGVRGDVPDLLQAMDVFVFPSLYEGLPVTLVEAQAAGLPCVVSENVPAESAITPLVERLSLSLPSEQWAAQILRHKGAPRKNTFEQIVQAGFDIKKNAAWLQAFYLNS